MWPCESFFCGVVVFAAHHRSVVLGEVPPSEDSPSEKPPLPMVQPKATTSKPYAAFVSHFKAEAAMEARWLQTELTNALNRKVFLDSDDLQVRSRSVCGSAGCPALLAGRAANERLPHSPCALPVRRRDAGPAAAARPRQAKRRAGALPG